MRKIESILWGLVLIVVGVIIGLNTTGITNINIFFDGWWTLFIIVPSFIGMFNDNDKTGNIIGLVIGVALLLACQNLIDFEILWKLLLPMILIVIGVSIIVKNVFGDRESFRKSIVNDDNTYYATFAEQNLKFDNEMVKDMSLNATFGGVKCDLREAIINEDIVINASAIFGGIEILVPENVQIKVKSVPIFGGVDNKAQNNEADEHTIYVKATCMFGGVDIK